MAKVLQRMNRLSGRKGSGLKNTDSLTEQAYAHLKNEIVSGRIVAGGQVDAKELAEHLGMSRTPVREAILRLANEGTIEVNARRGMRVVPLSVDDLQSVYQVITAIEVEAVFLLASSKDRENGVLALRAETAQMEAAIAKEDGEAWNLADERFHRTLLDVAGNLRLAEAGRTYRDIVQRAHFVALRLVPLAQKDRSIEAHNTLIDQIAAGDAFNARENHRAQRQRGAELLVTALRTLKLDHL